MASLFQLDNGSALRLSDISSEGLGSRGSAAAHSGKPAAFRVSVLLLAEATPQLEAEPPEPKKEVRR